MSEQQRLSPGSESVLALIRSAYYSEPTGTAENAWNEALEHIEEGLSRLGGAQPQPAPLADALRKNCGATNGCSCADLNYQWYGEHCEATMTSVFRTMLKEAALSAVPPSPVPGERYAVDDPWCRSVGKTWTPDQFWEYVGGLVGEFEATQIRDMLAAKGLSLSSTNRYCPNGLEHGNCLFPECVSSCPGRLSLAPAHSNTEAS